MKSNTTKLLLFTLLVFLSGMFNVPSSQALDIEELEYMLSKGDVIVNGSNWSTNAGQSMTDLDTVDSDAIINAANADVINLSLIGSIDKPAGQDLGRGIAFLGPRMFFSGDQSDSIIYELNPDTGAVINTIDPGLGFIIGLAANPVDGLLYVQACCGSVIQKVNPDSGRVVDSLTTTVSNLQGLAIHNNLLYGSENGGPFFIHEIDINTGATLRSLDLDNFPNRPGNFTVGNIQGIEVFDNTIFLNVDDAGIFSFGEIHEFKLADFSYIGVGYTGFRAAASGYDGENLWIDIEGQESNALLKLKPGDDSNTLLGVEKLINYRARPTPSKTAQLLTGSQFREEYRVTNNSPDRVYKVQVFENGQFVCNLYALDPGETVQGCSRTQIVLDGYHNVAVNATANVAGSNRVIGGQTNAYYIGRSNATAKLIVAHYVNDEDTNHESEAITVNNNEIEVLFRVKNSGGIELYRIRTYHDPASPVNSGWQQQCFIGTLDPGEVRYCKRTISVTEPGLNMVFGRAQGVTANVSPTGLINAANPSYFNVVVP